MLEYKLTFAGVPFVTDTAKVVRMGFSHSEPSSQSDNLSPRKHQPLADLMDEVNRLIPLQYLQDFTSLSAYPGRNLGGIAYQNQSEPQPNATVRVGDWYYPTGAARWSVFRGLAVSSQVKAMLAATQGNTPKTFVMDSRDNPAVIKTISSPMYMLPPRCISETGGSFDGLYLITLVDERYYFQGTPVSLTISKSTTWDDLIAELSSTLNLSAVISYSAINSVYSRPEPDSQFWTRMENASILLDAVAYNIGRVVVRNLDGTYSLLTPTESVTIVNSNRGPQERVVRTAGGDIFVSGTLLPVGDLTPSRQGVVPANTVVTFPKYIHGNDPVPHFLNSRYANQRPSAWIEDCYGSVYPVTVPIASGGPQVSGMTGVGTQYLHTTAKAYYETEIASYDSYPANNQSGLIALAMQLAQDRNNIQVIAALDEVYPGCFAWAPEGIHDIVWTYSTRARQGTTRVMRTAWNQTISEFQHAGPPSASGYSHIPKGVGGHSVAQTIRDSFDRTITTNLNQTMLSGDFVAVMGGIDYLPTQNRWRGQIDNEVMLFEGTSGGTSVGVVYRGIDGTTQVQHDNVSIVTQVAPDTGYGVNLTTHEKMQFIYPSDWTSGGIAGVNLVPQTQTVFVLDDIGKQINSIFHYSGAVNSYDTSLQSGSQFPRKELVWITDRNGTGVSSGLRYDGQFVGFSAEGPPVAPVYTVNGGAGTGSCDLYKCPVRIVITDFGCSVALSNNVISILGCDINAASDGVTLIAGDDFLYAPLGGDAKAGIYKVTLFTSFLFTAVRRSDANTSTEMKAGTLVYVEEGADYGDTHWRLTTDNPIILNTTALDFRKLSPQGVRTTSSNLTLQASLSTDSLAPFSYSYDGNTLTVNGLLDTMDGQIVGSGAILLLRIGQYGGLYTLPSAPADPTVLIRNSNMDDNSEFYAGRQVYVRNGGTNQGIWKLMNPNPFVLNTTIQEWKKFSEFQMHKRSNFRLIAGSGASLMVTDREPYDELQIDLMGPVAGCGLQYNGGSLEFDPETAAGRGLKQQVGSDCKLQANIGCGLQFDVDGVLLVNNTDLAGPGLSPMAGGCGLTLASGAIGYSGQIKAGCGIFVSGTTVSVNSKELAGKGLKKSATGACALDVDLGCHIEYGTNLAITVNPYSLLGYGVGGPRGLKTVSSQCPYIVIDTGCGLDFDSDNRLIVDYGCGLQCVSSNPFDPGQLSIKVSDFAGTQPGGGAATAPFQGIRYVDAGTLGNLACDHLVVAVGCGIQILNEKVAIKLEDFVGTSDFKTYKGLKVEDPAGFPWDFDCEHIIVSTGCGLAINTTTQQLEINLLDFVGSAITGPVQGLYSVVIPGLDCPHIAVATGCGLYINTNEKVAVNVNDFVGGGAFFTPYKGLKWTNAGGDPAPCDKIEVAVGCGIHLPNDLVEVYTPDMVDTYCGLAAIGTCQLTLDICNLSTLSQILTGDSIAICHNSVTQKIVWDGSYTCTKIITDVTCVNGTWEKTFKYLRIPSWVGATVTDTIC